MKYISHLFIFISLSLLSLASFGQATTDVQRTEPIGSLKGETFRPRVSKDGIIDIESAQLGQRSDFGVGLWSWYAKNPILLVDRDDPNQRVNQLLSDRVGLSLNGFWTITDWFSLGVELPFILYQDGETEVLSITPSQNIYSITSFGLGEIRLMPKIRFRDGGRHGVYVSGLLNVWLPTESDANQYFGGDGLTVRPALAVSQKLSSGLQWGLNTGLTLRDPYRSGNIDVGQSIDIRGGLRYFFGDVDASKVALSWSLRSDIQFYPDILSSLTRFENALETNIGLDWFATDSLTVFLGGGGGLIAAPGVPDYRAMLGVTYEKSGCPDQDKDGICDDVDRCMDVSEDMDDFEDEDGCPDPDNDGDGVLDVDDKCPSSNEDVDGFEDTDGCLDDDNDEDGILDKDDQCPNEAGDTKRRGCPIVDRDADGVLDVDDKCPDTPGVPAEAGCPLPDKDQDGVIDREDKCPELKGPAHFYGCPDSDGDGFPDPDDGCPTRPEVINGIRDTDGCPDKGKTLVKLTKEKIEIKDRIYFATGKSQIKRRSHNLLNQVAQVLLVHKEIEQLRIEGHTDSVGSEKRNLKLSDDRAHAVMQYLLDRGVTAERLSAVGYGESRPVSSNKTKRGRSENRRVDFMILKTQAIPTIQTVTPVDTVTPTSSVESNTPAKPVDQKAPVIKKEANSNKQSIQINKGRLMLKPVAFRQDKVAEMSVPMLKDVAAYMKSNPAQGPYQVFYRVTPKNKDKVSRELATGRIDSVRTILSEHGVEDTQLTIIPLKLSKSGNTNEVGVFFLTKSGEIW